MNSSWRRSRDNLQNTTKKRREILKDMKAARQEGRRHKKPFILPLSDFFLASSSSSFFSFTFFNNTNNEKTASNEKFFSHIFFIIIIIILRFILSIFLWETNLLCQKVCFHNNIKLISFLSLFFSLLLYTLYCLCCCLRLTLSFQTWIAENLWRFRVGFLFCVPIKILLSCF